MAATLILLEGQSGTGKSTSWETMDELKSYVITPNSKPLAFEGGRTRYCKENKNISYGVDLMTIAPLLKTINEKAPHIKYIFLEDFTHHFNKRVMDKGFISKKVGGEAFAKWNELASDIMNNIITTAEGMRDDVYVIVAAHTQINENGMEVLKTPGKLLDQSIDIPSYFTYIFHTNVIMKDGNNREYRFLTNSDGVHQAKTSKGCFKELYIPNDMKLVIDTIDKYQSANKKVEIIS